jgi:hypothetical protein
MLVEERTRRLADDELADEIEMYGELVVVASEADHELSLPEIDAALGLEQAAAPVPRRQPARS